MANTCKECGGKNLSWFASNTNPTGISQGRLTTGDVQCVFTLGCDDCSATVLNKTADQVAAEMNATSEEIRQLKNALSVAKRAILKAVEDTLWCDDSPHETVLDRIDACLGDETLPIPFSADRAEKIEIKVGGKYITRNGLKAKVAEIGEKYAIGSVFSAGLWWLSVWLPDGKASENGETACDIVGIDNG